MANRGTHHGDYGTVPQQLLEGSATQLARPLHPYMDPKRQVTKALPGMHLVHKRILLSDEGRKLTECEAHMRRANQRSFKDEFLPRMKWEGVKEGYYFTTGFRGTGYYLDDTWCDYNDPDQDGYVLVRAAPAVAMHRVLPKRGKVGKQGLLFDAELLRALGPAHGKPPHRYKLVAPPWLCEMRPPVMKFEKENMMQGNNVEGSNQMLKERVEWIAWRMYQVNEVLATRRERKARFAEARFVYGVPKAVVVKAPRGAVVRAGVRLDSAQVAVLAHGAQGVAVEEALNDGDGKTSRCRLASPAVGWVSLKVLKPVKEDSGEFGSTQKARRTARARPPECRFDATSKGSSLSNPRLVAEFDAPADAGHTVDVAALMTIGDPSDPVDRPEDDADTLKEKAAARAIVALPARCGEVAFKGDALVPVLAQAGPWTVVLEFGGADAFERPLVFKATLKKSLLLSPVSKLLETFAKKHAAKYPSCAGPPPWAALDAAALRLFAVDASDEAAKKRRKAFKLRRLGDATADHVAPETLICEVVEDLDAAAGAVAGAYVVRRKLGSGKESRAAPSARTLELEKRAEERGPIVDDWSSQLDHIRANNKKGWGEQQTSEEIREYWEHQKNYKHWRTTAALKGFSTRTEDEAKLEKWSKTLIPQAGFLDNPDRKPAYTDEDLALRKERDAALGSSEGRLQEEGSKTRDARLTVVGDVRDARKKWQVKWRADMGKQGKLPATTDKNLDDLVGYITATVDGEVKAAKKKRREKKEADYAEYWGKPCPPGMFASKDGDDDVGVPGYDSSIADAARAADAAGVAEEKDDDGESKWASDAVLNEMGYPDIAG